MHASLKLIQKTGGIRRTLAAFIRPDTIGASAGHSPCGASALLQHYFSTQTTTTPNQYATVDHSEAYEAAMEGPHGQQLALARLEGEGKDELPFDPFSDEPEVTAIDFDDDSDEYDDDIVEAEIVDKEDEGYEEKEDEDEDEESDEAVKSMYNPDGSVRRKKSVLATLRAGFPAGGQFAIIGLGGAQHKVTTDDLIVVNRLQPVEEYSIGSVHTLTDVMLVGSSHKTLVGIPFVGGAEVDVMVEEITRDAKVIIFKKRRKKHSQRKNGFRRDVTMLRVLDIRMPEEHRDHTHIGREIVDSLDTQFDIDVGDNIQATVPPSEGGANQVHAESR